MSSSPIDLTLPPRAPTEQYQKENHDSTPFAVYTLVDLGEAGADDDLRKAVEGDDTNFHSTCKLAPRYNFIGHPLMTVYNYHLELAEQREYYPTLFIVAQNQDYEKDGVLLVNLDVDLDCRVETCRIQAEKAASALVNIRIANMDWEDFKEDELPPAESTAGNTSSSGGEVSQQASTSAPSPVFGLYSTAGANMTTLPELLDPDFYQKHPRDQQCHSVASYPSSPDPWKQLMARHPWNCMRNPSLHRQMFVCADKKEVENEGVFLVRMQWDGNIDRDPAELIQIGAEADVKTRRCQLAAVLPALTSVASGQIDFDSIEESTA